MAGYDYIIVGAGSAGCVLANRLSEDPANRVLLVEAGPVDVHPYFRIPKGIAKLRLHPTYSWRFPVEPSLGRNSGEVWPRGRVIGGTSSINGMFYVRGQPEDYDAWERMGNAGWGWSEISRCFIKMEDHELGPGPERGVGGPLHITFPYEASPTSDAFIEAGQQMGLPRKDDLNEGDQAGVGYYPLTTWRKRRWSAADAFLKPALGRPNLTLKTGVLVDRVLFDGKRAVGIECRVKGKRQNFSADREVILSAGTIKSPQILQLSGVGPERLLRDAGVALIHESPQVGLNMREHLSITVIHRLKSAAGENREYRGLRLVKNVIRYYLAGKGPLSWSTFPTGGFAKSAPDSERPNIQFFIGALSFDAGSSKAVVSRVTPGKLPGLTCFAYFLHPDSHGSVTIRSADPNEPPIIQPNWLASERDKLESARVLRFVRELMRQPALAEYLGSEVTPGPDVGDSDESLMRAYVQYGSTANHAVGTCAMGPDASAVVDECLRVRGVENLRVVDCSVFPTLPSGNTNAPVMAVAWRASELILANARGSGSPGSH